MDDQRKTSVNKPLADWVPKSQRNSGGDLDDGCNLSQASAGEGLDQALSKIEKVKP
jgi:hypothetical protein